MERVTELFPDEKYETRIWVSDSARKQIRNAGCADRLMVKLKRYAERGFRSHMNVQVRHDKLGVYRIGDRNTVFRLLGFFEGTIGESDFIIMRTKANKGEKKQNLTKICKEIAQIVTDGAWEKDA